MARFGKLCASVSLSFLFAASHAQTDQQQPAPPPTLRVTSNLVFLDVTVLDKKGQPVVSGLTKDDFTITEDGKPQNIFSFEAPEAHAAGASAREDYPEGQAPVTILVLDLLNSRFEDFAFIRYSVRRYLLSQPEKLTAPAELLVVGNRSLEMLQGYTRSRADLLYALDHLPAILPYKMMNGAFWAERFDQSLDALQQIALQNKGVPGRKNIIWVGHGGPNLALDLLAVAPKSVQKIREYVHMTTNMLVEARISLFVIYPGLPVMSRAFTLSAQDALLNLTTGNEDPFSGDINFGLLSNETGGKLFYNRNDVDQEIARSAQLGANYYTLTYQPEHVDPNGKFRHVRVTVRDRSLRVITKAGYYAPDDKAIFNPDQQRMIKLAEALQAAIPIKSLEVSTGTLLRHPDARTVQMTVLIKSKNLEFLAADSGKNSDQLLLAAASLDGSRRIVASRLQRDILTTAITDPGKMPYVAAQLSITLPFPRTAKTIRVVVEDENGGRIGSVELDKSVVDNAPQAPTPSPGLVPRSRESPHAAAGALQ